MRTHTTIRLFIPIVIAWVMVTSPILGWRPALAEKGEPTLRELIEKRGKKDRVAEQAAPGSRQLDTPEDALARGVPRSSVEGFLTAARNRQYAQAAEYLDWRSLTGPMAEGGAADLARRLKIVFDRVLLVYGEGGTRVVTFSCTGGLTDCCTFEPAIPPEGYRQPTDVESAGGISGLKAHLLMFLAGVFLGDEPPAEPAPDRLDFTDATDFKRLEPQIAQTFYIGDGRGQEFVAPDEATRLYLGFVDGYYASGPPGFYDNNRGALEATVKIEVE